MIVPAFRLVRGPVGRSPGLVDFVDSREEQLVECLNFVLMFVAAWLIFRQPQKERLAFGLLVTSVVLMVVLFSIATRTSWLPGVNY